MSSETQAESETIKMKALAARLALLISRLLVRGDQTKEVKSNGSR